MPLSLTIGVFLSVLCDNLLLTVVVPILPELLRENTSTISSIDPLKSSHGADDDVNQPNSMLEKEESETCLKQLFHLQMVQEDSKLGLLLSTKAIMQLICNPIVGTITLKIGYKYPLLCGNCILLLCCLLFGFANSYILFIIGRSFHGLASSLISVAGMALIAELYQVDEERTKFLGRIMSGAALGVLIGYPFGGLGYTLTGKTLPFIAIGSLALFNIGIYVRQFRAQMAYEDHGEANALKWLQKWHEPSSEKNENDKTKLYSGNQTLVPNTAGIRSLLKDKSILIIVIAIWFSTTSMSVLEPTLPIWLIEKIDPPKWQLGIVFVPDSLGYFLGTNFFGKIAIRVGRWKLSMASMSTIGVACLLLPFGNNILQLAVPHFLLGLGLGAIDASLMPLLARIADEKHNAGYGTVYALAQTSVALAYSFGPLLGGQLVGLIGFPELIRSLGVLNLLFSPFLYYIANSENEMQESSSQYLPYHALQDYHSMKIRDHGDHIHITSSSRSISNSTSHSSSILGNKDENDESDNFMEGCKKYYGHSTKKVTFGKHSSSKNCSKTAGNIIQINPSAFKCPKSIQLQEQQPPYKSSYKRFYDELDSD